MTKKGIHKERDKKKGMIFGGIMAVIAFSLLGTVLVFAQEPEFEFNDYGVTPIELAPNVFKHITEKETIIENYNTGVGVWTQEIGQQRIMDYTDFYGNPVYVDDKHREDSTNIYYETTKKSFTFNKNTCNLNEYDGGKLTGSETAKKKIISVFKEALNSTNNWNDILDNENCDVEYFKTSHGIQIIVTKSNFVQNNSTGNTGLDVTTTYDFTNAGTYEVTWDFYNRDSTKPNTHKYGASLICDGADCDIVALDGVSVGNGNNKNKNEILGKNITIGNSHFDLKNEQHDMSWALKKQANKVTIDFTHAKGALEYNKHLIIDPLFAPTETDFQSLLRDGNTGGSGNDICDGNASWEAGDDTALYTYMYATSHGEDCIVSWVEFDATALQALAPISVTDSHYLYEIMATVDAETVTVTIGDNDMSALSVADRWTELLGADEAVTDMLVDVASDNNDKDLSSAGDTIIENFINGGSTTITLMFAPTDKIGDGTTQYQNHATSTEGSPTPAPTLEITYELPVIDNNKPTSITSTAEPFLINGTWSSCTLGCSDVTGLSNYNFTNIPYATIVLPINAGSDTEYPTAPNSTSMANTVIHYPFDDVDTLVAGSDISAGLDVLTTGGSSAKFAGKIVIAEGEIITHIGTKLADQVGNQRIGLYDGTTDPNNLIDESPDATKASLGATDEVFWYELSSPYTVTSDGSVWVAEAISGGDLYYDSIASAGMRHSTGYSAMPASWNDVSTTVSSSAWVRTQSGGTPLNSIEDMHTSTVANKNNATKTDVTGITLTTGLLGTAIDDSSFPLNFTTTDNLIEGTNDFHVGAFVNRTATGDFTLLSFRDSGNEITLLGMNDTKIYVRTDNFTDVAGVDNTCNLLSWCHFGFDRNSNTFTFTVNGTTLGTNSSATDLATASNDEFFIGYNATIATGGDFSEDFSSCTTTQCDGLWLSNDVVRSFVDTSNDYIDYTGEIGAGIIEYQYYDLGTTVCDSQCLLRVKIDVTALTLGSTSDKVLGFGISDSTLAGRNNQDTIGILLKIDSSSGSWQTCETDNQFAYDGCGTAFAHAEIVETLWFEIIRTSTIAYTVEMFSDEYITSIELESPATVATTDGMQYIKVWNDDYNSGSDAGQILATIDDIIFCDGVTSFASCDLAITDSSSGEIDEYYIKSATDVSQDDNITSRGYDVPTWIENLGNQTFAECDGNTNEFRACRVTLHNGAGNSTDYSDLIYGTTDNYPDAPSIVASSVSETQIDIVRTAGASDGGDPVVTYDLRYELNDAGGWINEVTDGSIVNFYNITGLSPADIIIAQWRDTNGVGDSPWSSNATAGTFADTVATVTHSSSQIVGNALLIEPDVTITAGAPEPITVTSISVYFNGSLQETQAVSQNISLGANYTFQNLLYLEIPTNSTYNMTSRAIVTNTTGTITTESTGEIITWEYDPTLFVAETSSLGLVNYTVDDTDKESRILKVNRPFSVSTWDVSCYSVTGRNNAGLAEWNANDVAFIEHTMSTDSSNSLYITCVNPPDILFSTVSYGNLTGILAGFSGFDDQLGSFFGLPMVMMFVLFVAGLFGGRQGGTSIVIVLAVIAILGGIGLLTIDEGLWGIILIMGALGLFASRVRF